MRKDERSITFDGQGKDEKKGLQRLRWESFDWDNRQALQRLIQFHFNCLINSNWSNYWGKRVERPTRLSNGHSIISKSNASLPNRFERPARILLTKNEKIMQKLYKNFLFGKIPKKIIFSFQFHCNRQRARREHNK
jgi:hypothetical protein